MVNDQITRLENIDLSQLDLDQLEELQEEVSIMLQTKSYREHYLDRLVDLEESIMEAIMGEAIELGSFLKDKIKLIYEDFVIDSDDDEGYLDYELDISDIEINVEPNDLKRFIHGQEDGDKYKEWLSNSPRKVVIEDFPVSITNKRNNRRYTSEIDFDFDVILIGEELKVVTLNA
jgi:hypothetical protein